MDAILDADKRLLSDTYNIVEIKPDRAVLAGIESADGYDTLSELAELCETAGIKVVAKEQQRRRAIDAGTYIGSGKAEELALTASAVEADIFVFDDELSAIQLRNLELILGLPIIDRTMLILDIFAQRAQSREGKLQVELAQLKYRLPRLLGMGKVLSRQGSSAPAQAAWAPGASFAVHGAALLCLAGLLSFAAAANAPAAVSRPAFRVLARMAMAAMIILQLGSLGILAWLAFRSGPAPAGVLLILSIASMLAMGTLGSPSIKGRFSDQIAMNWVDEGVNSLGQAFYAAAAFLILLG